MAFTKQDAPNCDWCPYKKSCFFDLLGDQRSRSEWKDIRLANRFRPGEVVYYEGDRPRSIFIVCTGKVKIYKSSRSGQQLVTRVEAPGDLLGHIEVLAGSQYTGTGEAMDESVVSQVDGEALKTFLINHPRAGIALLGALAHDVRRGEDKARDIAFKPARSRLANSLLDAAKPVKNKLGVMGLKRKDLAEMSGLTIETTVRLLKDFEKRGLLRKQAKDLIITDEPNLRSISERFS